MAEQPDSAARWDSGEHGGSSRTTAFLHNSGLWHDRQHGDDGASGSGPLRRSRDDRLLGGVAAGLARRTGFSVGVWRVLFVTATIVTTGYLAIAYVLAWLFIPAEGSSRNIASKAVTDRRGIGLALALTSVLAVALIIVSALHAPWVTSLAIPLLLCAAGVLLIARNATDEEQDYLRGLAEPAGLTPTSRRSRRLLRVAVACALGIAGLAVLLRGQDRLEALKSLAGIMFLVGGIALAFGPWWLRLARDAIEERQARVRAEERAEMASRVHDSVLQTLALIQRRAGDQQQVIQLARAQERELRAWLFDGREPGSLDGQAETVADGIRLIQKEVESQHGMSVEAVTVGDCPLDDDMNAVLAAAREATVNAAKWSRADVVSLFAEVEPESVSVFVRDRGKGFDPESVPEDRKGVAESIKARLARRGGSATVRSAPGQGTEVSLVMPRLADDRLSRRP